MQSLLSLSLALLLLTAAAGAADFTVKPYKLSPAERAVDAAMDTAKTFASQRDVARDFQAKYPNDMGVQLKAASFLAMDDVVAVRNYYADRVAKNPRDVAAVYLAGRLQDAPAAQREWAQKLLTADPDSYWGNLLLASAATPETDPELKQAEAALHKAIAADNSLPFAVERLGHLLRMRGDTQAADAVFVKLAQMQPDRFEPVHYRILLLGGDHAKSITLLNDFLKNNSDNIDALYTKARAERELNRWPEHVATMRRMVAAKRIGSHAYDLACGFSLAGQPDSAYAWLFTAVELGFSDIEQYKADEDLIPLRADPRWNDLLTGVERAEQAKLADFMRQAAATAPERKQDALAERQSTEAPDWTVEDLDGKRVALADLRGKVVIIDFWATWCGPCRKTMPLLDKFFTESLPAGVAVFGMNVWERGGTAKVKPYIQERGYKFPVLYGTDDIATAYGVRGIPTLVVIDQQGKIAYRHIGYDPTLPEVLSWQTKELLK